MDLLQGIERDVAAIGRDLFARTLHHSPTPIQKEWWQDRFLEEFMREDDLRVQLFRFVDVFPALTSTQDIVEAFHQSIGEAERGRLLSFVLHSSPPDSRNASALAFLIRRTFPLIARKFICGPSRHDALRTIRYHIGQGMACSLDQLGEATTSAKQADRYAEGCLRLLDNLSNLPLARHLPRELPRERKSFLAQFNISLKLSSLDPHFDPLSRSTTYDTVLRRLRPILQKAMKCEAFVNIDMEHYAFKDLILEIFMRLGMENEIRSYPHLGIVIQAYLKDSEIDLKSLIEWAKERGTPFGIRLVKGAYWDHECMEATQRGWKCPTFDEKWKTDTNFEKLTQELFLNHSVVLPAIATHNIRSIAKALALADRLKLSPEEYEFQMLYGMAGPLKKALLGKGSRLRVYIPYGPLIPGMSYLIRRLLENTSNDSFLRQTFTEHTPVEELLEDPAAVRKPSTRIPRPAAIDPVGWEENMADRFMNEPIADFSLQANRDALAAALQHVRDHLCPRFHPLRIEGRRIDSPRKMASMDPSYKHFVIGEFACAMTPDAEQAVAAAKAAFASWRTTPVEERAALLRRLAEKMRVRRYELAAWVILETGKPWREADADVAEAIDFCEFYAGEMLRLANRHRQRNYPGETNHLIYEPRGVAVIIAPWNFPLAILTGMSMAALVTGNTVVLKPAEQSSIVAAKFFEILEESGLAPGVANFLPGIGEEIGPYLVSHPDTAIIAFTGSRAVGIQIQESAALVHSGQRMVKRVITEMGGKNAIIVDATADLDEAVQGVVQSAFGYAGQKCSACARVITLPTIHQDFLRRLVEAAESLPVGPADMPETVVGPLIDEEARQKVLSYIEIGKSEANLLFQADVRYDSGFFVGPTIFDKVNPRCRIAQEEIFGPVLSVIRATDFQEAIEIANDTPYGLTGGLYSRTPPHVELAKRDFRVGNLYINRSITGAIVDRQPFGGMKLSGIGWKAGGPDYLVQFCDSKTVTENTVRHGFAPTTQ